MHSAFKFLLVCVLNLNTFTNAADPSCSRGIKSYDSKVCCPKYCGRCGGDGCSNLPGGYWECCVDGVIKKNRQCSWSEGPCTMSTAITTYQPPVGNVRRPVALAILPGDPNRDIFDRMRRYGARVDSVLLYQNVQWLSWPYVKSNLDAGLKVQLTLEFFDSYPNLWDISGGKYDDKLRNFFNQARNDGRRFSVRILHEFNGDWYNWGVFRGGSNSFDAYKAAFRRVSGVIRSTGANVQIMMQYNSLNARNDKTSFAQQYPGDQYLDAICISAYNFCGISQWHTRNQPIAEIIGPWYKEMVAITSKPLCIGEMSSTNNCGNKPQWLKDTWNALAQQFPRINTVTFFFQNKWQIKEDLDLNSQGDIDAWRDGLNGFKWATGYALGDAGEDVTAKQEVAALKAREQYEEELKARGLETSQTKYAAIPTNTTGAPNDMEEDDQKDKYKKGNKSVQLELGHRYNNSP